MGEYKNSMCFPIEGGRQIHANLMFIHTDASFLEHEKYAKTILLIIKMVILYFFFPAREDISLKKKEYESRGQDVGQKTANTKDTGLPCSDVLCLSSAKKGQRSVDRDPIPTCIRS